MDEEQVLRDRLSVEERNLRRVTKKHSILINSLEQGNIKDVQQQFNDFMVDFSSYELTLTRFQAIHDMNLQETRHWNEEAQRIEQEIKETKLVIKNLEKELAQEEEIRRNKAEYDQLAGDINEQKTREESLSSIAKLDDEIISLEEKDKLLDETLDRRRSQLQRILRVVQEVQNEIEIEREQNPQVVDDEEAATTPDSIKSEFFSPIANPSSPAEDNDNNDPPQINGINGINSSSSNSADNDEGDRSNYNDENKQQNNEENSPQQQSQEISALDNLTEVGEDMGEVGELATEVDEDQDELGVRDDVTEPDDVETIDGSSDGAEMNQNVEIEDLDDGDVVTSDNEKNTIKYDEENEDDVVPTDDGDDGEIVEDSDENQRGEKRKRSDEEEEEEEEGLIKEKIPRLSSDDEGLIEESEDEGVIIKDEQ